MVAGSVALIAAGAAVVGIHVTRNDAPAPTPIFAASPLTPSGAGVAGLGGRSLAVTHDGGRHWIRTQAPYAVTDDTALAVDGAGRVIQATSEGGTIQLAQASGSRWTTHTQRLPEPGFTHATIGNDGSRTVAVTYSTSGSPNTSAGIAYLGADLAQLTPRDLPAGGTVQWASARDLLLTGGLGGASLYASSDSGAHWAALATPVGPPAPGRGLAADAPTFGTATRTAASGLAVPVTLHSATGQTAVTVLTRTVAGAAFTMGPRLTLSATSAVGAAMPIAARSDGSAVVTDPATGEVYTLGPNGWRSLGRSLPVGALSLSFSDSETGWAVVQRNACSTKSDCSSTSLLYTTTDGGSKWSAATVR